MHMRVWVAETEGGGALRRAGGEAWEPDTEPARESGARTLQPAGHRDMLPSRPTTALAPG